MLDPLDWIDDEAKSWTSRGLDRRLAVSDGRSLVNFASNDYLGLASDPRVIEAAVEAAKLYGWGSGASPLVSGWSEPHEVLSRALAEFERVESVALFSSGYAANLGAITALVGPGDVVYLDRLNHACLVDGARLSRAKLRVYPHKDVDRLEAILNRDRGQFRRSLIATDGVFSMDGDVAPLADLVELASRFGAMLLVDEAHGTGVHGPQGRGASELCGVHDRIDVKVGTLSKALGSIGGFVAGSRRLFRWLINRARPLVFSTSLPPSAAAAAHRALVILQDESWRRVRLLEFGQRLRQALPDLDPGGSGPIVPLILGGSERAVEWSTKLLDRGLLVPAIRPPTVPEGTARLRISLSAAHSSADLDRLIVALQERRGESTDHPPGAY
jgi:8-amino-7-oxononanoate synthase